MQDVSLKTTIKQLEQQIAKAKNAFKKVDALLELAKILTRLDTPQAIVLSTKALELSRTENYNLGSAKALYYLAGYYSSIYGDNDKAMEYAGEALKLYTDADNAVGISHTLGTFGTIYTSLGDNDKALDFLEKSRNEAVRSEDFKAIITASNRLATLYYHKGNYTKAIELHSEALQLSREQNDTESEAIILNNLAHSYNITGNIAESLRANKQSLEIKLRKNDIAGVAISHMNIAALHIDYKDYAKALEHLQSSLEICNRTNNFLRKGTVLMHIGTLQYESGHFKEALEAFKNAQNSLAGLNQPLLEFELQLDTGACEVALGLVEEGIVNLTNAYNGFTGLNSLEKKSQTCKLLATAQRVFKNYPESLRFAKEGMQISEEIGSVVQLAENHLEHAQTLFKSEEFAAALDDAFKALEIGQKHDDAHTTIESFKIIADIYDATGDFQNSAEYYRKYLKARENELNTQTNHKVQTLLIEFDVERMKHEAEINKLKSEQYERELTLKNKELITLALHLVNKNEFLKTIGDQISEDVSNTSQVIKNLSKLVQDGANSEEEWKLFEKQFIQVNPDFTTRLAETAGGTLTATELKICSLLRTGLNSQDVANVLFLSKRTVENHRYNIHRKLKLGDEKLVPYLMKL